MAFCGWYGFFWRAQNNSQAWSHQFLQNSGECVRGKCCHLDFTTGWRETQVIWMGNIKCLAFQHSGIGMKGRSPALDQSVNWSGFSECTFLAQRGTNCGARPFCLSYVIWQFCHLEKRYYLVSEFFFAKLAINWEGISRKELWDEEGAWEGIESYLLKASILPTWWHQRFLTLFTRQFLEGNE